MRNLAILMTLTTLAACSGGDAQSASGVVASPVGGTGGTGTGGSSTDVYAQFKTPTASRTYAGIGATQVYKYSTDDRTPTNNTTNTGLTGSSGQQGVTYGGNASTVRDSKIQLTYDPRAAIFTLSVTDPLSGAAAATRFQDPGSRTSFGGAVEPQWGVTDFALFPGIGQNSNIRFLQAGDGDPLSPYGHSGNGFVDPGTNTRPPNGDSGAGYQSTTLFYEVPGSGGTNFVSLAGYVRNDMKWVEVTAGTTTVNQTQWKLERGAFAYGIMTDNSAVPTNGTGTYTGDMVGTLVFNPTLDSTTSYPTFFQWLSGTSTTTVNFGTGAVALTLNGIVGAPQLDRFTTPQLASLNAGTTFTASGTATIDLVRTGGFTGQFQSASFGSTNNGASPIVTIAGSSLDGAFFGPAAENVGGGFRITGGTPDQRIDIAGAFKGTK
ncbi:MAG: transferrin-binding protein-like solute binding protein [Sphingomonadales bacterium]